MRFSEVEKYRRCYAKPSYRMGKRRRLRMEKDISMLSAGMSLLDVGAGRGETINFALENGILAEGIEIVPELCRGNVRRGCITEIPVASADAVTCYDVLEHLPPEDVSKALDELLRVASQHLFVTISGNPDSWDGDTLHLSIHPWEWWHQQFTDRGVERILWTLGYCTDRDWHAHIRK